MKQAGKWGRFEIEIINNKEYKDPFSIDLKAVFLGPDGRQIDFWGFYDGDNVWKVRFMPDQTGIWKYQACFSDDSISCEGTFECVASDIPGLIHKDELNPIWFGYKGGNHVLIRSFHVGDRFFAENWENDKRTEFLDWLQSHDYNMLSIASHYLNRDKQGRGLGWKTPKLWPLDAAEYRKMEEIMDELERRRILVYPFAGFFGRESYFPTSKKDQIRYIKYTYARLGAYCNVLMNAAGPEPLMPNDPYMNKETLDFLGRTIKQHNVFDHLVTVHNATSKEFFRQEEYVSYITLQGPKTLDRKRLLQEVLDYSKKGCPMYAQETLWAGNNLHPEYTDDDLRKNAYVLMMSASAINYADMDGDSSSGFSGSLELKDAVESRHRIIRGVWDFFGSLQYYKMSPHPELVDRGYCLADKNKEYLVYLDEGGSVSLELPEGQYIYQWINARDTSERTKPEECKNNIFTAPDEKDWILHLKLKKFYDL